MWGDDEMIVVKVKNFVIVMMFVMMLSFGVVMSDVKVGEIEIFVMLVLMVGYIVDDVGLMLRLTATAVNKTLKELEDATGFYVNVIMVRKLVFEIDLFVFGDKVLEMWYLMVEEGNDKGNLLLVKSTKDGALVGGLKFLK